MHMVTHIVLWNLKDKTQKAQQGGEMKRRLEALVLSLIHI